MLYSQTIQTDTIIHIDTVFVLNHCFEGVNCTNHIHGIIDTTFYFHANVGKVNNYIKVTPSIIDNSINCDSLNKKIFENIFYPQLEVKQKKNAMQTNTLTSFDTIKPGTKVFPAAKPFIPHYFTHSEPIVKLKNDVQMIFDISCFNVLIWATVGYVIRSFVTNSWSKLWNDIISA